MNSLSIYLISNDSNIIEALNQLNRQTLDPILFVVDTSNKLVGSLTDGDIRRGLLSGIKTTDLITEIIHKTPKYIQKGENDLKKIIEYRERNIRVLPIVDRHHVVKNVISFRDLRSYLPVDAVIMAGGRGDRLRPLTDDKPKPLLPVGDKPILEHNIDRLRLFGIDDFWITLRYLSNHIIEYFGDGSRKDIHIEYVHEKEPLGTIGSVSTINNLVHDYVLVLNSDLLTNMDYEHFFLDFIKEDADMSVVTIPYSIDIPYGVLETNNGYVINFCEKPTYTYYTNGGIYLIKKEILKYIPFGKHYNATDLIEYLISINKKVISYPLSTYWLDIGRHEDYLKANRDINNIKF